MSYSLLRAPPPAYAAVMVGAVSRRYDATALGSACLNASAVRACRAALAGCEPVIELETGSWLPVQNRGGDVALHDMTKLKGGSAATEDSLTRLERTTFAAEGIQERAHLQAALRDHIELIDKNLFVIAEEFGDFEGVSRRIDLLCLDKECKLVVVELKRTADGGHMELQALRYAAMISTMTFAQVVRTYVKYRQNRGFADHTTETAKAELLSWLELGDDEAPAIPREVGIVLASEDFSQEITTTVLWLNEFHAFDIRCVRLTPCAITVPSR